MGKRKRKDAMTGCQPAAQDDLQRKAFFCPACNQKVLNWPVFSRHLQRCCPDLLRGKAELRDAQAEVQSRPLTSCS